MSELDGLSELMEMSEEALAVSSCVTPHGLGLGGRPALTPTPIDQPTGDTPRMLMNSVNRYSRLQTLYDFVLPYYNCCCYLQGAA